MDFNFFGFKSNVISYNTELFYIEFNIVYFESH